MRPRNEAHRLVLVAALLLCAATGFGPAGPGGKVTAEQLAYSKQMFAEGQAASEAGDHATALAKFHEGYRYAPHLHVFTVNIAGAAEALGDCRTAYTYYRMFLDLVPKHPQRKEVQKKYDALATTCQLDEETEVVNTSPEQVERKQARGEREGEEALGDAITALLTAQRAYDTYATPHAQAAPFARAAKRKKKDAKRMRKLAATLAVKVEPGEVEGPAGPGTANEACREGVRLEHRIIEAVEAVLEHHDSSRAQKVGYKVLRAAERDESAFEGCRSLEAYPRP